MLNIHEKMFAAAFRDKGRADAYHASPGLLLFREYVVETADWLHNSGLFVQFSLSLSAKVKVEDVRELFSVMSKNGKDGKIGNWGGIVSVRFDRRDKDDYKGFVDNNPEWVLEQAHDLVAEDNKITLSWDSRSDCFMASISCYNDKSPNYKHTMISRAPTLVDALGVALYKHVIIAERDWGVEASEGDVWG